MKSRRCKFPERKCDYKLELENDNPKKKRVYCEAPSWWLPGIHCRERDTPAASKAGASGNDAKQ